MLGRIREREQPSRKRREGDCGKFWQALPRNQRCRGEITRGVEHGGEQIWNRIHRDEDADPFRRKTDGQKERRQQDERAARNAGHGKRQEHRGECDRGELTAVQRNAVEPADEERSPRSTTPALRS